MDSDALRKNWKALSQNGRLFFEILYEEQGCVSEQELSKKLSTIWLAPIARPRNGKNKVHPDGCVVY